MGYPGGQGLDPSRLMGPRGTQPPAPYEPPPMSKEEDPRQPKPPGVNKSRNFSPEMYGLFGGYGKPRG